MKKQIAVLALILSVLLLLVLVSCGESGGDDATEGTTTVPGTVAETTAETTAEPPAETTGGEHEHVWDEGRVTKEGSCDPSNKQETKGEITYTCTVCGETRIEETAGHDWYEKQIVDSATCLKTGTALFECTRCKKRETRSIPVNPNNHTLNGGEGRIVTPPTPTTDGERERICSECYGAVITPVTYDEYSASVTEIKEKARSFAMTSFGGGSVRADLGGSYAATPVSPTRGQHPRVLFNASNIEGIENELHDSRSRAANALYRAAVKTPTEGKLASTSENFSYDVLNKVQTLALDYALTGNEISGYSAINGIKNVLTTMNYDGMSDVCRYYGYTMYIAACVYDWCYDLLSGSDKTQIILGVQNKCCGGMEVGFPPTGQSAICGHGCEYQLLRDYLAFAIAIYDEYPGWWNMIGGRYYADFVPIREVFYEAGMYPQGVSLYLQLRYAADLWSAWLIYGMSGTIPYNADNMKQVARTVYSHELPGRRTGFNTGDDHVPDGSFINYGRIALFSSYLFDDATMRALLEKTGYSYSDFSDSFGTEVASVGEYLICSSHGVKAATDVHEGMPTVLYNGGWLGQTIARNDWSDRQAAVLMKVGVKTTGNHDHLDCGQFQIYYRSILAGDTGAYVKYGEDHHYFYHQATIAHNSLLIYNPSFASSSTYNGYYSGGQTFRKLGEISKDNYDAWMNGTKYVTGTVTGHEEGFADGEKTQSTYAYIAGNLTAAYDGSTVSEVTRRMLAVFNTGHPDVPMYFFVFDNIAAKNASFKKTFLLHTVTEPTIEGKTVTEVNGNGKLVLQNVIGNNVTITKIGGEGKNYWINKKGQDNYVQLDNSYSRDDNYWGRVEISPATGNTTDRLLNVMFVCDADKSPNLKATAIDADVVKGAVIGRVAAVFVTSATRRGTTITFETTGSGEFTYYVSGVKAGEWTVAAGGKMQTVAASEDGGLLVFTASAGQVTLTPKN